jgi:hypothetical protein
MQEQEMYKQMWFGRVMAGDKLQTKMEFWFGNAFLLEEL